MTIGDLNLAFVCQSSLVGDRAEALWQVVKWLFHFPFSPPLPFLLLLTFRFALYFAAGLVVNNLSSIFIQSQAPEPYCYPSYCILSSVHLCPNGECHSVPFSTSSNLSLPAFSLKRLSKERHALIFQPLTTTRWFFLSGTSSRILPLHIFPGVILFSFLD